MYYNTFTSLVFFSRKYNENYHYIGDFSYSDTIYRSGVIEQETNFEEINRGTFYQNAAKVDDIIDPEVIMSSLEVFRLLTFLLSNVIEQTLSLCVLSSVGVGIGVGDLP